MNKAINGLDKVTARRVEQLSRETGETLKKITPQLRNKKRHRRIIQNSVLSIG